MAKPIVSVLVPVYNVEDYLEKCLDSIIAQTINNIEIICVNDGSTDDSLQILKKYKKKDRRLKIITKENGGLPSARNAGLDVAKGKYIGFVDSDDYIEPNMYETMVYHAENNNSDVVICGANIFPENPRADKWLYDTLSPWNRHYEKFDSDMLLKNIDTNPFLWRTIVKKSLIDSRNFRLDEDVVLGEDKAFQCKVYPYAKGITVISDKLYNYYWCRPGSLMEQTAYSDVTGKIPKHVKLVKSIADYFVNSELEESEKVKTCKNYFDWAIPFIHQDYIYSTYEDKIKCAKELIECFENAGAYQFYGLWEDWKKQQFKYIKAFSEIESKENSLKQLSVIIPAEFRDKYLEQIFDFISESVSEKTEYVFVNNGMKNECYSDLLKLMMKKKNVRLFNTAKHMTYADLLNQGVLLSEGKYVTFLDPKDWYISEEKLLECLDKADKNNLDCCVSKFMEKESRYALGADCLQLSGKNTELWEADFHDGIYKKSFLLKEKITFKSYATFTGLDFYYRVLFASQNMSFYNDYVYCIRKNWKKDWLETAKCEKLLECLDNLLQLAVEHKNKYLHCKVYSILNNDEFKHMILNGTKLYHMSAKDCPNGENGQIKTMMSLFSIANNVDIEILKQCGYESDTSIVELLYEVVSERQRFLANI